MSTIDYVQNAAAAPDHAAPRRFPNPKRTVPVAVRAAQILSFLLALPMTVGSFMFAVVVPDHHYAVWVTWVFAPIAFAAGLGLLATAPRLAHGGSAMRRRMLRLLVIVAAFSLVKLTVFSEVASIPFLVLACLVLGLLSTHAARAAE